MAGRDEVQLLLLLKGTVEGLLVSQVANVWSIYGGLNRLHSAMERIFKHGYRVLNQDGEPDLWVFINGLSWLQPNLATSPTLVLESFRESQHVPPHVISEKALMWIYKSLETHSLSQKLSWLLSDREHLLSCYENTAFLSQEKFGEAALICLRALEHNQPSLLTEINPCLYMTKWNPKIHKSHRRCSSFPETLERCSLWASTRAKAVHKTKMGIIESRCDEGQEPELTQGIEATECSTEAIPSAQLEGKLSEEVSLIPMTNPDEIAVRECPESASDKLEPKRETVKICLDKIKAWNSLPSLLESGVEEESRDRSLTVNSKLHLLNRSLSSRFGNKRCGSHTVPSTPYRSNRKNHPTTIRSATVDNKLCEGLSPVSVNSKISPSVLRVDYTGLQSWDSTDGISKSGKTPFSKGISSKNMSKRAIKNSVSLKLHSPKSTDTVSKCDSTVTKESLLERPKDLDVVKVWQTDSSVSPKPDNLLKVTSRKLGDTSNKRKPGSAPSLCEWGKDSPTSCSGTPVRPCRKSFMEDGGSSVQPMSTGFFPRPIEGQSLTSFLSSGQFSRANAELDRENAHFSISEAMIAAIEQVKCNRELQSPEVHDEVGDESDEEINHLKQRLRLRRHQRQEEQRRLMWGVTLLSDGKTDTTTTDQSISPLSTSPGTPSDSISTDGVEDMELDEAQNIAALKDSGLSMSMASLYSEAELSKHTPIRAQECVLTESVLSAEGVALSLIRQFSEKQLPRASDLNWLVSEQEVPQQLLPLPKSWPVSPDDVDDDMRQATPLRGNMEWAPPRPQIIFTLHPSPVRRILMAKQSYRCAGCGMRVAPAYAHRFRYCEYLGRYFCTGCHANQLALIPGRVLTKWDFTRYTVSNFSFRLLDQMYLDPLFSVADLSPGLYRKSRALERCRQLRLQLFYLKDFVLSCRFASELQEVMEHEPTHIINEVDVYSMHDLEQVKLGELPSRLRELVTRGNEHTSQCQLCRARGFVCELCSSKEIIFPWQLARVSRCSVCGACYHIRCQALVPCPRCQRMSARRKSRELALVEDDVEVGASDSGN